jgi:DNA processing protein
VLSALRGITARKLLEVASRVGTASACLAEVRGGRAGSETDRRFAARVGADDLASGLRACGARFVAWGDEEYPPQLGQIHDPPAALFVRGAGLPRIDVAVAVVGARTCSDLGREIARSIGGGLAASGITVVSGAARGIDAAAHEGALAAGGRTVAALGCGIDQTYPRGSRALIERIADAGALISEYPPGVPPEPFRFPARNRIVAGLAGATVVVEGAPGSGSLITGDHALEFGRDVYAVPGAVTNPLASVPLELIREGATMIRGVEDLLLDLKLDGDGGPARRADVSLIEQAALDLLAERVLPERIARGMGLSVAEVIPVLMSLEMKGLVRGVGGRYEPTLAAARPGGEPARP